MLVLTLLLCAFLAVVLVAGLEVAALRSTSDGARLAVLQMEQLHRSAVQEALAALNERAAMPAKGEVLLADEPLAGQRRKVTVTLVERRVITLRSESALADGSRRTHHLEVLALQDAPQFGLSAATPAVFSGLSRVSDQWLTDHRRGDMVLASDRALTIGSGAGTVETQGSVVVLPLTEEKTQATLVTDLVAAGNVTVAGDLQLRQDLSCKEAAIGGTLTIDEGVTLHAKAVYLAEGADEDTLARIDAAAIYLPEPPAESDWLSLPEPPAEALTRYLMLQPLN